MEATQSDFAVSRSALVALINHLLEGYPDPDSSTPDGPWDPVIRQAFYRTRWSSGPFPIPWRVGEPGPQPWSVFEPSPWSAFGPQPDPWRTSDPWRMGVAFRSRYDWAALNPQPLPPRITLVVELAHEVIDRTSLLYDLAGAFGEAAEARAQEVADSRLTQFIDDCGNGRIPLRWPRPPRGNGTPEAVHPVELVVMGVQFVLAAQTAVSERLQQGLSETGARLLDMGLARVGP